MNPVATFPAMNGLDRFVASEMFPVLRESSTPVARWMQQNGVADAGLLGSLEQQGLLATAARRIVEVSLAGNLALTVSHLLSAEGLEWYREHVPNKPVTNNHWAKIPGLLLCADVAAVASDLYAADAKPTMSHVGQTVGSLRIRELLGCGPLRTVYQAESLFGGGKLAVKIIPTHGEGCAIGERFLNGALVASCLGLPGCHPVHFSSRDFGCAFLVMPLMEQGSLDDRHQKNLLPACEATQWCAQTARILAAIHTAGYAHGNIKLGNILIGATGPVLTDFALPDEALSPNSPLTYERQQSDVQALLRVYEELLGLNRLPWEQGGPPSAPAGCVAILENSYSSASELAEALDDVADSLTNQHTVSLASHVLETMEELTPSLPLPNVGDTLGKCVLTAKIGVGSTGVVYKAMHQTLGVDVAVKVLSTVTHTQQELVGQFRAEAQMLARMNHPNIVRIWDFENRADCLPYLILEFVDGQNLAELLKIRRQLPSAEAIKLFTQVVGGLQAARQQTGLIHRDIKPANILLNRDGIVKVADLGLSSILENEKELTAKIAGTPAYMPPEQADGIHLTDVRSDIYSLGVTLYETVTGRVPFAGKSRTELIYRHALEKPLAPAQIVDTIPIQLSNTILKMLAKLPDDRFQNYDELLAAFSGATPMSKEPVAKEPHKDVTPSRLASFKRLFTRPKA